MVNRRAGRTVFAITAGIAAVLVAGCVNFSSLDDLKTATASGSPFNQALFSDYAFLAHSFGDMGQASYTSFDQEGSFSLNEKPSDVATLANQFAAKALQLSQGQLVDPEPSRDVASHDLRDRLIRALTTAQDVYPRDAARAQADWDCWRLNLEVTTQAASAAQCKRSFDISLGRLENEATMVAQAAAAKKPAAPQSNAPEDGATLP